MSLDVLVVALEDISVEGVGWSSKRVGTCEKRQKTVARNLNWASPPTLQFLLPPLSFQISFLLL